MTNLGPRLLLSLPVLLGCAGCAWAGLFETTLGSVAAASALATYAWIASALLDRRWRDLADSATDLLPEARRRTNRDTYNRIGQALHGVQQRLDKDAAQIADLKRMLAAARSAGAVPTMPSEPSLAPSATSCAHRSMPLSA